VKRPLLAAALLLASFFALARADEGAYGSLLGMARSAEQDRGPDADDVSGPDARMRDALKDAVAQAPAPRDAARAKTAPSPRSDEERSAAFSPEAPPRIWTRLYSTLLPSWRRRPSLKSEFEPAVSSAAALSPRPAAPAAVPDAAAVKAGERRGLAELLSASAAPSDAQ
jgi:hypothetical protein